MASKKKRVRYRSGLEEKFADALPRKMMEYEPFDFDYTISKKYKPDFVYENFMVECKGFFREGDTQKYKAIRDAMVGTGWELIFVLSDPYKKVRKGAKLTMGQWCEKENIAHFSLDTVEELIKYVTNN